MLIKPLHYFRSFSQEYDSFIHAFPLFWILSVDLLWTLINHRLGVLPIYILPYFYRPHPWITAAPGTSSFSIACPDGNRERVCFSLVQCQSAISLTHTHAVDQQGRADWVTEVFVSTRVKWSSREPRKTAWAVRMILSLVLVSWLCRCLSLLQHLYDSRYTHTHIKTLILTALCIWKSSFQQLCASLRLSALRLRSKTQLDIYIDST